MFQIIKILLIPDSKMASVVPMKDKKLMDVKIGELPKWILMRDFTPKGIAGAFQRLLPVLQQVRQCEERVLLGFPWCWQLTCFSTTAVPTRNSSMSSDASTTEEGSVWRTHTAFLTMAFAQHP
ncbi:hypothetical protein mRhiFer1_008286 [Rhinolophus ferrumequinum]|uniref:ATP synthase F(0) complex subunit f, mitochondrial n=1 Tax=Rhinolophus ferrumequinum TaxID=59479 RepID=A0A7J7VRF0_RHIFE|nr:hypothetical protein mRhiFer1_008286 [Rhinolophus ferrumequinum]